VTPPAVDITIGPDGSFYVTNIAALQILMLTQGAEQVRARLKQPLPAPPPGDVCLGAVRWW
jgi:hypothetical protein